MKASYTHEKIKAVNVRYEAKYEALNRLTCCFAWHGQRGSLLWLIESALWITAVCVFSIPAIFVFHKQMKGVGLTELQCDETEVGLVLNY